MTKSSALLALTSALALAQTAPFQAEGLPDKLVARLQIRDRFLSELPRSSQGFSPQFVMATLKLWDSGSTVRVAFNADKYIVECQTTIPGKGGRLETFLMNSYIYIIDLPLSAIADTIDLPRTIRAARKKRLAEQSQEVKVTETIPKKDE